MKEEIKEILDKLQRVANSETASRNALMEMKDTNYQLLLNYITNLQEENEKLNKVANERMQTILEIEDNLNEYITSEFRFEGDSYDKGACRIIDEVSNIINELKGDEDE